MTTGESTGMTADQRTRTRVAAALLAVVALVLGIILVSRLHDGAGWRAQAGEKIPLDSQPYGRESVVELPSAQVTTRLSPPVTSLDHGEVGHEYETGAFDYDDPDYDPDAPLTAPEGGVLVPVSWTVVDQAGINRTKDDPHPIDIVLVAGDERVDLDTATLDSALSNGDDHDIAIALESDVDVDDLSIEVTYDGVTQTVSGEDGSVDAGRAAALYEDDRPTYTADCSDVDDRCDLTAVDPDSVLRPRDAGFIVQGVGMYAYDQQLGWAEEGQRWATFYVQLFGVDAVQDDGNGYWDPDQGTPVLTLDGAESVRSELQASEYATGYVQFAVDADDVPKVLRIEQTVTLPSSAPLSTLDVAADVRIRPDAA